MRKAAGVLVLSVFAFCQSSSEIVRLTESRLKSLRTFQADFEQTYYSSSVSTPLLEKGRLIFEKPDSMRWEYRNPEEKTFVSRNGTFQFYIPEDNQLLRGTIGGEGTEGEILFILSGQRSLLESYGVEDSSFPTDAEGVSQLKLIPKNEDGYSFILLEVEMSTRLIRRVIFFDWAGNKTEIMFRHVKTNVRVPPNAFDLKVPADVEIVQY